MTEGTDLQFVCGTSEKRVRGNSLFWLLSWFLTSEANLSWFQSIFWTEPAPANSTLVVFCLILYSVPCLETTLDHSSCFFTLPFFHLQVFLFNIAYISEGLSYSVHIMQTWAVFKRYLYIQQYCLKSHLSYSSYFTDWASHGSVFSKAIKWDHLKLHMLRVSTLLSQWVCTVYLCIWNNKLCYDRKRFVH